MKTQWSLLLAILFAVVVAVFAVMNVEPVEVDYFFGIAHWPLILVVLGSVLAGVVIMGAVGAGRIVALKRELRKVRKQRDELEVRNNLAAKDAAEPDERKDLYNSVERTN
ncbi:lipopolysaccharide assembly LapA domain-containing protein [Bacillus sp. FJAT-27445]|uniref:LapA family protein n=1 Tax=Bacillus sp. FJAT-27445 TaxID=1679166 RepID=UPI0007431BDD|nr:lipopolysaccharide assembly protein LapA domain-containing protein [Bacillus sp. FJAT-27445]